MRLLSTKILSQNFRDKLLMNQFSLVELAFIKISFLENPIIDRIFDRLIFTSQNAVNAVYSSPKIQNRLLHSPLLDHNLLWVNQFLGFPRDTDHSSYDFLLS